MDQTKPLRVTFISHSDTLGGAAIVTYRLMRALRRQGVDAKMVVYTKLTDDPNVSVIGSRFFRGLRFLAERFQIMMANGFSREKLFKVSTGSTGCRVYFHPWVKEADVVSVGWINQGLVSIKGIRKLHRMGKPIVWTMHDMWCMTGICHHAYECSAYKLDGCGNCQFLGGHSPADLSRRVWLKKKEISEKIPMTFVAVSHWLADRARESVLLRRHQVHVIHNAFPADYYSPDALPADGSDPLAELGAAELRVVMCAARIDDTIKGLPYAIDALNYIFDNYPDIARRMTVIFVGELRDPNALDTLRMPSISLGRVNDPAILRRIYGHSQVVLSTSLYETLGGTLVEGQSMGCLPVTFDRGGQVDVVTHKVNGYVAEYKNIESVAEGIIWACNANIDRMELHRSVVERFSSVSIARQYTDLFLKAIEERRQTR